MPTRIIKFDEDDQVVCPICHILIMDEDEGLVSQPSCPHILFVYANGEAFEFDAAGFEERLNAAQEEADEAGDYFDEWEWLSAQCGEGDVIVEQVSEGMACGPVSFRVWIGIRGETESSKSRPCPVRTFSDEEYSAHDHRVFFRPTRVFVRWMKANHSGKHIYDIGCGVAKVSAMLSKAGMHVTAIDLQPREKSNFLPIVKADSTVYPFDKGSVVMLCRPCHEGGFVRETILNALKCGVRAVVYVGLNRNVRHDLGGYYPKFVKRRIRNIGHADELVWEMTISRLQAKAHLQRGAIPPLSSDFSR
jgi:hypothetical protein